jgi:hypothetical protein
MYLSSLAPLTLRIALTALVFLLPLRSKAQETLYNVTLGDQNLMRLAVSVQSLPDGRKVAKLVSQRVPGAPVDLRMDGLLRMTPTQDTEYMSLKFVIATLPPTEVEAFRLENGSYRVQNPPKRGIIPYGASVYTVADLLALPGRRYDWTKGGPQKGVYVDPFRDEAVLDNITLEAGDPAKITFGEETVAVKTLNVTVSGRNADGKTEKKRSGTLYVGPFGETLKVEGDILIFPFSAKEPSRRTETGYETEYAGIPIKSQVQRTRNGLTIRTVVNGVQEVSTLETDVKGTPTHWINRWRGHDYEMMFAGNPTGEARYRMDASNISVQAVSTGRPWFLPYAMATEIWETGKNPFAEMAIGDKREGDNFLLYTGQRESLPFTLERREDVTATIGGKTVTLRHYHFDGNVIYEYYTDGKRLVVGLGSDKSRIIRDGAEEFAKTLKVPDVPNKS